VTRVLRLSDSVPGAGWPQRRHLRPKNRNRFTKYL